MSPEESWRLLTMSFCGRLGTVDAEGWPYVVPKLYVVDEGRLYFHSSLALGHTRQNLAANSKVCFEVDRPGKVFPVNEGDQCATSLSYESVIVFGHCRLVEDRDRKRRVLEKLMDKYADPSWQRPWSFPTLDETAVFEVTVEQVTGKRRTLAVAENWKELAD